MTVRDWYYAIFIYKGCVYVGDIDKYNLRDGIYIIDEVYCPGKSDEYTIERFRKMWVEIVNAGVPAGSFVESGRPVYHDDD